jgi:lipopolysaccharide export system permease protein
MRILTRYLLRMHAGPFLFSLSVLTGLLFVNAIARRLGDLAGKGLGFDVYLEVFALSLPHIIALTLPMAVLVSVLYAFSVLAADNEITALKAGGINLVRLLIPLVAVAVLLAIGMVWFNDRVLPETNHRLKNLQMDVGRKSPTFALREQVINPLPTVDLRNRYYLQAANIDHATNRLYDVVIYDMSLGQRARTVYADSGRMALNEARTDLLLTLFHGWVHEVDTYEAAKFRRVDFGRQMLVVEGVGNQLQRLDESHRGDREMSLAMLRANADSAQAKLAELERDAVEEAELATLRTLAGPNEVPGVPAEQVLPPSAGGRFAEMPPEYIMDREIRESPDNVARNAAMELARLTVLAGTHERESNRYTVEYHKKFAIPVACIVFVLIGAPLAVRFPRGGVGMVIAISLAIFGIYYMSLIGGESLGDRGYVSPFLGPWGPNAVFALLAIFGLTRIGKETSTTRGGGWDDLWLTVRRFVTAPFRRRRRAAETTAPATS